MNLHGRRNILPGPYSSLVKLYGYLHIPLRTVLRGEQKERTRTEGKLIGKVKEQSVLPGQS